MPTACASMPLAAEESTAWPGVSRPTFQGGLGFGLKWNMGAGCTIGSTTSRRDHVHPTYHHSQLTFGLMYALSENFVLALSHDEVVHGKGSLLRKMAGDRWQQLANLRALYGHVWAHPGKKLLFMGGELAQQSEWNPDGSLDWYLLEQPEHAGMQQFVRDLNLIYRDQPRSGSATSTRQASAGWSSGTLPRTHSPSPATTRAVLGLLSASRTCRPCRGPGIASACRAAASGARC